jgi:site-specific recombinase XerD
VTILEQHLKEQQRERDVLGGGYKDDDLVFARPDGSLVNPRNFGPRVVELAERAKVKVSRFTVCATRTPLLAKQGVPLEVVGKHLGHADIPRNRALFSTSFRSGVPKPWACWNRFAASRAFYGG